MKMKITSFAVAIIALLSIPFLVTAKSVINTANERYIVKFKQGGKASLMNAIQNSRGQIKLELDNHRIVAVELPAQAAEQFKKRNDVELVELDPKRYLLAESTPYGIEMVEADQVSDLETGNMKVCIMDTGYDREHYDLPDSDVTVTGDDGYDRYDTGNWYEDGHGHGTHVSGTIAALGNNSVGVVGVNPSGILNLHMVKVFTNNGSWAYGSDLIAAIDQCMAAEANVISMSLGGQAPVLPSRLHSIMRMQTAYFQSPLLVMMAIAACLTQLLMTR